MTQKREGRPKGLLNAKESEKRFSLSRFLPGPDTAPFIEHYWLVRWDLRGREPYTQENLPYPSVHVVFEPPGSRIYGIMTGKLSRRLEGAGFALGIKFRPGGFYPFARYPVARIIDRTLPLESLFGDAAAALEARILRSRDDEEMVEAAEGALREILPAITDENVAFAGRIVDQVSADRTILRVEDLAARAGMSQRSLQRLFNRYVGASPKWVIARYRLFEAAEKLERDSAADAGSVALELGYFDQAHFNRDFSRVVGSPPARYARAQGNPQGA